MGEGVCCRSVAVYGVLTFSKNLEIAPTAGTSFCVLRRAGLDLPAKLLRITYCTLLDENVCSSLLLSRYLLHHIIF